MDLSRQSNIFPQKIIEALDVLILGVGGTGSNIAYNLASTGVTKIMVYDHDTVSEENIAPQFYGEYQIGKPKVEALANNIYDFIGLDIGWVNKKYEGQQHSNANLIISAVDGMARKRAMWNYRTRGVPNWEWWIDTRMGATQASVICVGREYLDQYLPYLEWKEADDLPCGEKATAPLTKGIIPGLVGKCIWDISHEFIPPLWQSYDMASGFFINVAPKL